MKLLIDIGNTRAKWAMADVQSKIVAQGIVSFPWKGLSKIASSIESVWVSCVANEVLFAEIEGILQQHLEVPIERVRVNSEFGGMRNAYKDLDRLGVDRWVAALGAREVIQNGPLIIVDAGTAATVDIVSDENVFEGGVILPGMAMMHDALVGKTAGIQSERDIVRSVIGRNTQECVNSGALYGLTGAIERVINEIQAVTQKKATLLIAGGDAELIISHSKLAFKHDAKLIFYGLLRIAELSSRHDSSK